MGGLTFSADDAVLTFQLHGEIDADAAAEIERRIAEIRAAHPAEHIVVDCADLTYMASAGLRIILRLKKSVDDTRLINVSSGVYEVLRITGFTDLMEIQKAFRVLSVEGCERIGEGANGLVYRMDADTVVKVYRDADALPAIRHDQELARTAFVLGVPTAIPYDVVRIEGGGYGSVFELLNTASLANLVTAGEKTLEEAAVISTDLLKRIHGTAVRPDSMPDMRRIALDWVEFLEPYLPADEFRKLYGLIEALPEDRHMLHGDFHIKNIMLQNDEALLIDMDTLCWGHPVFELGSMFNAYRGFGETDPSVVEAFLGISAEKAAQFWDMTLRLYLDGADEKTVRAAEDRARIIGYMRIMRRRIRRAGLASGEGRAEVENCRKQLADLLPKVDSLLF